jgi:hypothetical protein
MGEINRDAAERQDDRIGDVVIVVRDKNGRTLATSLVAEMVVSGTEVQVRDDIGRILARHTVSGQSDGG